MAASTACAASWRALSTCCHSASTLLSGSSCSHSSASIRIPVLFTEILHPPSLKPARAISPSATLRNEGEWTVRVMKKAHHTHASRQAAELLRVAVESERGAASRQKRARQTLQISGGFCEVPLCQPVTHQLSQKAAFKHGFIGRVPAKSIAQIYWDHCEIFQPNAAVNTRQAQGLDMCRNFAPDPKMHNADC